MALNLYGETNYEVQVPFSVEYSREPAITKDIYQPNRVTQWKYTRNAQKTYKFKGMTEDATKQCLTAKRYQYNRRFMPWVRFRGSVTEYGYYHCPDEYRQAGYDYMAKDPYYAQVAQFNVSRNGDAPVYDLQITVNETIALYSTRDYDPNVLSNITNIETLFADQTVTPVDQRINSQDRGGPRYNSYLYEYKYDENLSGDVEVSV